MNTSRVVTLFIDMCCTTGPTGGQAASIFNKIDEVLKTHEVPWGNCVGFSVDNTSTNLDERNSVKTRVLTENQECYFLGCPCHIIHNTAHKGSSAFTKVTGFDVEDFCIDLYYFFDKSSKRKSILESYSKFCDQEYRRILKHVRWLSLERAIERILTLYCIMLKNGQTYFKNLEVFTPQDF